MLKVLLKKQLMEIFRSYFFNPKKNTARSKGATAAYIVLFVLLMVGVLGGMFTFVSMALCGPMAEAGVGWLYFALMALLAIFMGAFGSVFNTYSGLYLAKDNDLLLSMPIPVNTLMTARLLGVYLMGLMYSAVIILPAILVYWFLVSARLSVILGSLLLVVLISIFVLTLSCALGWVVAKISLKLKNRSIVTVFVSLIFIVLYYFFYFKAQTVIGDLVANAVTYGAKIRGAAYPVYLLGRVATGDPIAMLVIAAVVLALFALTWVLIARSFLRIATSSAPTVKRQYRERAMKRGSVRAALLGKELSHFIASPNYMLNCGLAILILPVAGIALIWKGAGLLQAAEAAFAGRAGCIPVLLCAATGLLATMNDMAAPSVSLEGKSLWLAQSLPVTSWQVLRAKLSTQLLLTEIPALVFLACTLAVYSYTAVELVLSVAVALLGILFTAELGLMLGLLLPNLTWTSEITPIKQSACVALALLCNFVYALVLPVGYLLAGYKLGYTAFMGGFGLLTLVLSALLLVWLKKRGAARFAAL